MNLKQTKTYYNFKPVEFVVKENYELVEDNEYLSKFSLQNVKDIANIPINKPIKYSDAVMTKGIKYGMMFLINYKGDEDIFFVVVKINLKNNKIVGFVRGRSNEAVNLYILPKYQGFGLGKKLFNKFENIAFKSNPIKIKINASLLAVDFYTKFGYKKSTGIKRYKGINYQPMIKYFK
jgi:GNAT superfamily N-acetyltransferase